TLFASPQDEAKKIVADAAGAKDPESALEVLNQNYAQASPDVKKAILADPGTKKLLDAAAISVNWAFKDQKDAYDGAMRGALRLNRLSQKLEPELAGALAEKVFQGHEQDYQAIKNGGAYAGTDDTAKQNFDRSKTLLNDTLKRIGETPEGQKAIT